MFLLCLLTVVFVRAALCVTKFTRIRKWLVRPNARRRDNAARAHVVARSVAKAARFVPKATCMTQAISGQAVLSWFGVPTELVIGAASAATPAASEATDFHAWLLWQDSVILGGEELARRRFAPLSRFSSQHI
ncbi:lasso peptide biosynthesis B2 protein [Salipiger sp. PrR002]|uniref:lasso peptide biosynthesis B2 protein n=1 Tax=Salipiger sp. PrR002 TaxID=2706489 RepID=UPI0013B86594|nr:lasso peptide biosynthesis B2 protein [Salipiger sp. PrR002]NDW00450.1 lasso peptide biosynthesis B2 protein [Salipiger sp. PrR002]NDW56408.1 lasso peptide biosynthesis B2 protein [Salipiger sp. PrR004]